MRLLAYDELFTPNLFKLKYVKEQKKYTHIYIYIVNWVCSPYDTCALI